MRRGRTVYFCVFCLVLLALAVHALPVARAGILDEKYAELEQMQKEIEETRKQIEAKRRSESSVIKELEQLELELELAQRELDYLLARIQYLADRIEETEKEIAEVEKKTQEKKDLFCDRLVCMYKAGRTSYLEVLLDSKSVSEFMARL